jgi:hypothetical protein
MEELECMRTIDEAIRSIEDQEIRKRIVGWLSSKYLGVPTAHRNAPQEIALSIPAVSNSGDKPKEIPGIAKLSASGDVQLTVRDFKARSANEAAVRLAHVAIWAANKLTGEQTVSSRGLVLPLLRKYRCYDGNTRRALAAEKGLVRDGDTLSLDFHAEQSAERMVSEILDPATEGKWKPNSVKRRATRLKPMEAA